jgi:vacuolar protein sorting-associated protein 13A/C
VAAQGSSAAAGDAGGGGVGRFRALIDTIIGNLELKISNIHIRYEDSSSNPGHTFCIGVLLSEISAHTVGEDWQRKFVTADALLTLRKVGPCCCVPACSRCLQSMQ